MIVARSLFHDDVIVNKIVEMEVKYLDTLYASNSLTTDWLIENNQEGYNNAKTPEEQETLIKNVEELKKNQVSRIRNADYYKSQIEFLQSILALKPEETFEINTEIKELSI